MPVFPLRGAEDGEGGVLYSYLNVTTSFSVIDLNYPPKLTTHRTLPSPTQYEISLHSLPGGCAYNLPL